VFLPDPRRSPRPALTINPLPVIELADFLVYAQILAGAETHREYGRAELTMILLPFDFLLEVLRSLVHHEFKLSERLLHLDDRASAVDQLEMRFLHFDVGEDQGEKTHSFTCTRWHLQNCMALE
jgi:hypothetical protein